MKRGTPGHPKTELLAEQISTHWKMPAPLALSAACGMMERLWHFTAEYAKAGDIGRYRDVLAARIGWPGEAADVVRALCASGLLDERNGTLYVHDWADHAEDAVHMALARRGERFADGSEPKLSRIPEKERPAIRALFARTNNAQGTHDEHTALALAEAEPEPSRSLAKPEPTEADADAARASALSDSDSAIPETEGEALLAYGKSICRLFSRDKKQRKGDETVITGWWDSGYIWIRGVAPPVRALRWHRVMDKIEALAKWRGNKMAAMTKWVNSLR